MRRIVLLGLLISAAGCGGTEEPPAPVMLGLAVTATGQGSGVISSSVGGLSCTASAGVASGTCSTEVREGTSVTLTATPVAGSRLASWTGACAGSGTALTCTLTVDEASQVGAAFELIPVVIETTTLPNARVGLAYSAALQASGGTGSLPSRDSPTAPSSRRPAARRPTAGRWWRALYRHRCSSTRPPARSPAHPPQPAARSSP